MDDRQKRLETFQDWPKTSPVKAADLAENGFHYTGQKDTVKCFLCNTELLDWQDGDIPADEHRKASPKCRFAGSHEGLQSKGETAADAHKFDDPVYEPTQVLGAAGGDVSIPNCQVCNGSRACVRFSPCCCCVTCQACAGLLNTCPRCNKEITEKQLFT